LARSLLSTWSPLGPTFPYRQCPETLHHQHITISSPTYLFLYAWYSLTFILKFSKPSLTWHDYIEVSRD
jgi:hypothetical protein